MLSEYIDEYQKKIFSGLADQNYLRNMSKDEFVNAFAALTEELNALHLFREGNGRGIRLFLRELAESAGWYVAYEDMEPGKLLDADVKAFNGDLDPLKTLLYEHTVEYENS